MRERPNARQPLRLLDGAGDEAEMALLRAASSTPPAAARERAIALFEGGASAAPEILVRSRWAWVGWSSLGTAILVASILLVRGSTVVDERGVPVETPVIAVTGVGRSPDVGKSDPTPVIPVTALPSITTSSATPLPPAASSAPAEHPPTLNIAPTVTGPTSNAASTSHAFASTGHASTPNVASTGPASTPNAASTEHSPSTAPPTNLLAEEVAALDRARRALREGDTTEAQRALDTYGRRFPAGVLAPEATLLHVEAMLKADDEAGARRLGEEFLAKSPNGAYVGRMRNLLQTAGHAP